VNPSADLMEYSMMAVIESRRLEMLRMMKDG
jgi:hypothetical protein